MGEVVQISKGTPGREVARGTLDGGGDGPQDGDMEARVAKLEAILPTLATKADVAEMKTAIADVKTDVHKAVADNRSWMLGTVLVLVFGMASLIFALTSSINSTISSLKPQPQVQQQAAATPQPIIIQVPTPPAAAPAEPPAPAKKH